MNKNKAKEFVQFAQQIAQGNPNWADWHNQLFGINALFQKLFPTETERTEFSKSSYQQQIQNISQKLRTGKTIQEYTTPSTNFAQNEN